MLYTIKTFTWRHHSFSLPFFPPLSLSLSLSFQRKYWADKLHGGIVTGGQYDSNEGCQPYTLPKCNHHEPGPYKNCSKKSLTSHTPSCNKSCISGYDKSYHSDKHYGKSSYSISSDVSSIQTEIMTNGPVEASFSVYADFPTYTSGKK